jgi:TonB family protein
VPSSFEDPHQAPKAEKPEGPQEKTLILGVALALVVHGVLAWGLFAYLKAHLPTERRPFMSVDLSPAPVPVPPPVDNTKPKQVVDIEPADTTRPKDAKYLAEFDSRADEEQKAPLTNQKPPSRAPQKPSSPAEEQTSPEKTAKQPVATDDEAFELPAKPRSFSAPKRKKVRKASDPLGLYETPVSDQGPSEHLSETKTGERAKLNAWQWKHAPFFNRIKTRIGQVWSPQAQITRHDPDGTILGQKDRVTIVKVTIDAAGRLTDVSVLSSSGVAYLDEEAERAFKAAAPFAFPPPELFAKSDHFTFQFGFYIQVNSGFGFDFDW